jgi:sigma-B regulation protein RsbU (phosphoserine phosphatase)
MLDEMPWVRTDYVTLRNPSKIICYTDGLSELKDEKGDEIGISPLIKHFSNRIPLSENISSLIDDFDITTSNERLFDDVSILAVETK